MHGQKPFFLFLFFLNELLQDFLYPVGFCLEFLSLWMVISCSDILAVQVETSGNEAERFMNQSPCEVELRGCSDISLGCLRWAIEPRTGIEFPSVLENMVAGEDNSNFSSEVNFY